MTTLEAEHVGANHRHRLLVVEVDGEPMVEVSEPGKDECDCVARWPLSEVCHLILNIHREEWFRISSRDVDAAGHRHEAAEARGSE